MRLSSVMPLRPRTATNRSRTLGALNRQSARYRSRCTSDGGSTWKIKHAGRVGLLRPPLTSEAVYHRLQDRLGAQRGAGAATAARSAAQCSYPPAPRRRRAGTLSVWQSSLLQLLITLLLRQSQRTQRRGPAAGPDGDQSGDFWRYQTTNPRIDHNEALGRAEELLGGE